jgi:rRNA pseudouridine-1189 N-methylase Emg1 (Nep1/Mra1 family)
MFQAFEGSPSKFYTNIVTSPTTCRQCGKGFKPQELHSHMQSCRGLRERMRSSARMSVDRSQSSTAKADHCSTERPDTVFLLTES